MMMVFNVVAFADTVGVDELVANANQEIEELILDAQAKAEAKPDKTEKIIEKLLDKTQKISDKTVEKGEALGVEILCEYVEVEINGIIVLVDPLTVVGW